MLAYRRINIENEGETLKKGIAIVYKNGRKDWFDPVDSEVRDGNILYITIENGNVYDVNMQDVKIMAYYSIIAKEG